MAITSARDDNDESRRVKLFYPSMAYESLLDAEIAGVIRMAYFN